jgi:hypothetical protein
MFTLLASKGSCSLHVTVAVHIISFRSFVTVCADDFEILVSCLRCLQVFWSVCLCGALVSSSFLSVSTWCFSFFVWPWLPLYMNSVQFIYVDLLHPDFNSGIFFLPFLHSHFSQWHIWKLAAINIWYVAFLVLDITWLNVIQAGYSNNK